MRTSGGGLTGGAKTPKTVSSALVIVPPFVLAALLRSATFSVQMPDEFSP